ncbi:MAG: energy transducer TonB [Schleiferiaceae bacterium]|jgi:protein TonB|nr:energy transducer TonB [Schleiferiaceae bacterium]
MKKLFIFISFTCFAFGALAQNEIENSKQEGVVEVEPSSDEEVFTFVESVPVYPGCEKEEESNRFGCLQRGIMMHISKTVQYPDEARDNNLEDKVYVSFVVDKEGKVKDAEILRGKHEILNKEALRAINKLPQMQPAMQRGKTVNFKVNIPINFKLH